MVGLLIITPASVAMVHGLGSPPHLYASAPAMGPADVLRDEKFGEPRLAHPSCAQDERVSHSLPQRQADIVFLWLNAVQPWQTANWWKWPSWIPGGIP